MKLLSVIIFFIGISYNVYSNKNESYVFKHISVEDGLSNNFVKSIYKDHFGYLWFGTLDGINRYDGAEIRTFNGYFPKNTTSVTSIFEDRHGKMWIGTETGLFYWDRIASTFTKFNNEKLGDKRIDKILGYGKDSLLFFSGSDFFFIDSQSFELHSISFHKDIHNLLNHITDFYVADDQLYISTEGGFIEYDLMARSSLLYNESNFGEDDCLHFSCLTKYNNLLFFGTPSKGVISFNLETRKFSKIVGTEGSIVLSLSCSEDCLFVGTDSNGLLVYDFKQEQIKRIEHDDNFPSSISSNAVYSILIDENKTLWTGTYAGGVSFSSLKDNSFKILNSVKDVSFFNKSVRSLCFCDSVRLIGTRDGMYVLNGQERVKYFSMQNSVLKAKIILSMFQYNTETVLVGTYSGGIYEYSFKTESLKEWKADWFSGQCIYAFEQDRLGNLWIGTLDGVFKVHDNNVTKYDAQNSPIQEKLVYALKIDRLNRLWVGTDKGVKVYSNLNNKLVRVTDFKALSGYKANSFYCDLGNMMWVAVEKHGLFGINEDLEVELSILKEDGLCDNSVSSIIEAEAGEYWISTLKGISRYSSYNHSFDNFFFSNGLPGLVFNPNAVIKDQLGTLWFGNEKGLVYFDPKSIKENTNESNLVLTDIYIGGKQINENLVNRLDIPVENVEVLRLRGKDNNIGFRFINLFVPLAAETRYAVKLEKKNSDDSEWIKLDYQRKVYFNSLKPGEYKFYMGVVDRADSVLPNSVKVLRIRIASEWYQSLAVFLAVPFFLIMAVFLFIYLIKKARKKLAAYNDQTKEKYEFSRLDESHSSKLFSEIKNYLVSSQLYLNSELKIADLAKLMNYSTQEISQAINQNFGQGFTDFINHYRVLEIKKEMKDPANRNLTLTAIAGKCGFNSKSSFYRAFKKVSGQTPAEYWTEIHDK
ncbi:two-component regulator propeller domain-containing protein [Labilibaculum sp. K2S]|uniref:two-component regulator propeller domain-containing protein n=1 Tax=Labilibaculum sp. K2S TaxID=3056386 RepID=UPI0025A3B1DB|nr:two-component regulator propeller domain-containing protein [Labilibaculum sp. K2S]MDM8159316.1 two-component regulator propeller domain-containing protein [Labilibaculum sp. K2S]